MNLYAAYGSNLNKAQMQKRCPKSKPYGAIILDEFRLVFKGVADIEKKNNSSVPGGLYEISKSDEKKLDIYEDYPILYKKMYFKYYNKTVMTYIMPKKTIFRYPTERYLNVVKQGYKDCKLDQKYLKKALVNF